MCKEQVYLAEVDLPVKASKFGIIFKDDSVITQEMFDLDGKTIEVWKNPMESKYDYVDGTYSFKTEWLKNIRPKSKKVLKRVPLDKGTIELGDWVKDETYQNIVDSIDPNGEVESRHFTFVHDILYENVKYSKDRGKTWLPMYKEVEVEE